MPNDRASGGRAPRRPGSQSALRAQNQERIISALAQNGALTQAELSRQTGLSNATVSNLVKIMESARLVSTSPTTSSGRRALAVRLDENGSAAVGIDVGRRHVRVALASPGYRILQEVSTALPLGHSAESAIAAAKKLLQELVDAQGMDHSRLLGAGIGIPGPIDRRTGTVAQGAILPEWVGITLQDRMEDAFQLPVYVDNDANLGALAEVSWGPHSGSQELMYVKIASGIGAGMIFHGALYYGNIGVTGEIGHATIRENGLVCRCGNRGCLETVASISTMINVLSPASGRTLTTDDVVSMVRAGDVAASRLVDDAGQAVGQAIANVANLINPATIVIGGPLHELGETLIEPIRRGLTRHAVPVVGESTELAVSTLGDRAEVLGAASLVLQNEGFGQVAKSA